MFIHLILLHIEIEKIMKGCTKIDALFMDDRFATSSV